jgi:pimeloyl-ACP methyl ester carboxylesterase
MILMILNSLIAGDGPPVLLLHGLFGAAKNLGVIARGLAPPARTVALDLRNHGESPHGAAMDYAAMAADVFETAASLGITSAAVVGHSMGGKTALALALARPDFVRRLAVLDIAPVRYDHDYGDYVRAMQAVALVPGLTRHAADAALAPAVAPESLRAFLLNNLVLGETPRWRLGLAEILAAMPDLVDWRQAPDWLPYQGPALFLRGGASDYVTPSADADIARLFPKAERGVIDGAGHWLHAEKPQQVIAALKEFLFHE